MLHAWCDSFMSPTTRAVTGCPQATNNSCAHPPLPSALKRRRSMLNAAIGQRPAAIIEPTTLSLLFRFRNTISHLHGSWAPVLLCSCILHAFRLKP